MNPTTPGSKAVPPDLQSTPQSAGSAARSKDLAATGLEVDVVRPWIARDIDKADRCKIDEMLKLFLVDCLDSKEVPDPETLLQTCLKSVLPICNGEVSPASSGTVKGHLEKYSNAKNETDLYPHFVNTANVTLGHLHDIDQTCGLFKPSHRLVFQVYGKQVKQSHEGASSVRKPDVLLVSTADVDQLNNPLDAAARKPKKSFVWRDIRAAIEFKLHKANPPPSMYTVGKYVEPQHHTYLSTTFEDDELVEQPLSSSAPQKSQSQSNNPTEEGLNPGNVDNSALLKRKLQAAETERESVEGSLNKSRGSGSKRLKLERSDAPPNRLHPAVQTGIYGAEMFASHAGREHVICLTIIGDLLYLWRYDHQGPIQCSALNFIQDLPHFLVLLLAIQRFENRHWGLNPCVDSDFGELSTGSMKMIIPDPMGDPIEFVLDCSSDKRRSHYGLNGRATNVFPMTSSTFPSSGNLVMKLFWSEESREAEPHILLKVYKIAENQPDVEGHVPVMVNFYHFSDSSTSTIRERLGLQKQGSRVLYMIVFQELKRISTLTGETFLRCWWQTVKCHLALWKNGVYHHDVSASNLMYKGSGDDPVGVLNDFDLATTTTSVTGNEHTGTIPFMARELLTEEALAGETKHTYAYDVESFIWVFAWICLRYDDGKRRERPPLDVWLQVDALRCREKKSDFLYLVRLGKLKETPGKGHEQNWRIATMCLRALPDFEAPPNEGCDEAFRRLLGQAEVAMSGGIN